MKGKLDILAIVTPITYAEAVQGGIISIILKNARAACILTNRRS
jgi:hypothetical protein